jgi:hypothetical protein
MLKIKNVKIVVVLDNGMERTFLEQEYDNAMVGVEREYIQDLDLPTMNPTNNFTVTIREYVKPE